MRTAFVVVAAVVASCILVSCGPKPPDMAALKKTVDAYNAASREALMGGNTDAPLAFFTDDGLEMAPNMAAAKGKDAIKAMWTQMMSSGAKMTAVDFTTTDLQAGGTVAYEIGTYAMTISAPDMGEMKDVGKYISLWRQQADGTWKLRAETWNTDTPMPPMEKPATKKK